jgi:hypothetical protein
MGIDVVDVEREVLRVAGRAQGTHAATRESRRRALAFFLTDHDQPLSILELAVHDDAAFTFHAQPHREAKGATKPIDRGCRVSVVKAGRDAWPTGGSAFQFNIPCSNADR